MKPIVIGQLFPCRDIPLCENDNVLISINSDDSRIAIGLHKCKTKMLSFADAK